MAITLIEALVLAGLILWLAVAPATTMLTLGLYGIAAALGFVVLAFGGLWLDLPWWTPHMAAVAAVATLLVRLWLRGLPVAQGLPKGIHERVCAVVAVLFAVISGAALTEVVKGRAPPDTPVDIASPFGPGTYLSVNGGYTKLVNAHLETLDPTVERFKVYRGQSYGVDLVKLDSLGRRAREWRPQSPGSYEIFGTPVIAPCEGTILSSRNNLPDLPVPTVDRENLAGNHVLIECRGFAVLLAHLLQGSVSLDRGDFVRTGQYVGRVGNSGNSMEPHLHIHAQTKGTEQAPLSGDPIPLSLDGVRPARNSRLHIVAPANLERAHPGE